MKNQKFVYEYWNRTKLGRGMIASNRVSESDLLFLIPNNVKKIHGLPLTRTLGKNKKDKKRNRRRNILSYKLFDILEEVIEQTLGSQFSNNEFFTCFVDFKERKV